MNTPTKPVEQKAREPADWDLEMRAFSAANVAWTVEEYQALVRDLWKAYCEAAALNTDEERIRREAWRPIHTAPKGDDPTDTNGPPILIWREGWSSGYEGFWYAYGQAWYLANLDSEYGDDEYPTHWQSLPEPPLSAPSKGVD